MNKRQLMLASALAGVTAVGAANVAVAGGHDGEKCYGVAKAEKNDCAAGNASCAGQSKIDGDKQAFIALPKGTCERLVGGSTKAGKN